MEVYKEEKRKVKMDIDGNKKLFWKELTKVNRGKVETWNRIKDGNGGWHWERRKFEGLF